jgi:hypothetical protein
MFIPHYFWCRFCFPWTFLVMHLVLCTSFWISASVHYLPSIRSVSYTFFGCILRNSSVLCYFESSFTVLWFKFFYNFIFILLHQKFFLSISIFICTFIFPLGTDMYKIVVQITLFLIYSRSLSCCMDVIEPDADYPMILAFSLMYFWYSISIPLASKLIFICFLYFYTLFLFLLNLSSSINTSSLFKIPFSFLRLSYWSWILVRWAADFCRLYMLSLYFLCFDLFPIRYALISYSHSYVFIAYLPSLSILAFL